MGSVSPGEPLVPQPPSLIFSEEGRRSALGFAAGQLYKRGAGLGCPVGARPAEVWGSLGVCREIAGSAEPLAAESNSLFLLANSLSLHSPSVADGWGILGCGAGGTQLSPWPPAGLAAAPAPFLQHPRVPVTDRGSPGSTGAGDSAATSLGTGQLHQRHNLERGPWRWHLRRARCQQL